MKFLRYSNSLTSCFTSNYINHHFVFSEENNILNFYIITSKNKYTKNQEHFFIYCVLSK